MAKHSPTPDLFDTLYQQYRSWRGVAKSLGVGPGEINTYAAMLCRAANGKPANPKLVNKLIERGLWALPERKHQHRRAGLFATAEEAAAWDRMMLAMDTTTTEWMRRQLSEWQESIVTSETACSIGNTG